MIRMSRVSPGVIVGVLMLTIPAFSQTALGTLRGVVLDQQGGALPGVTVTVRQVDTNTLTTAVTGAEGQSLSAQPAARRIRGDRRALQLRAGQAVARAARRPGSHGQRLDEARRRRRDGGGRRDEASPWKRRARSRPSSPTSRSTICRPSRATSARSRRSRRARPRRRRPARGRAPASRFPASARSRTASSSTARRTRCSSTAGRPTTSRRTGFRNSRS